MTKRILVVATALMAVALLSTSAFAADYNCTGFTGASVQFMAAGSSAQFNTFAYGAIDYAKALVAANPPEIWSAKNGKSGSVLFLQDTRFGTPNSSSPQDAANMWVVWAPTTSNASSDCYVWVYYSIDSTVGVKDFFAYKKITSPTAATVSAIYPVCLSGSVGCTGATNPTVFSTGQSIIPGLVDTAALPTTIQTFLTTPPGPTSATGPKPPAYCGQNTSVAASFYCYLNAGMTDIRPEDALYATSRALSAYSTTNGLAGLGYDQSACGAASTNQGCPIYTSQGTGSVFNVLNFAITGKDPVTTALEPSYGTLSTGASPVVVFVSNADSTSLGFGQPAAGGTHNVGPYQFTDINRENLSLIYQGTSHCTGDVLTTPSGFGHPIQVMNREPLSGTFNTFEFTAVDTMSGSALTGVSQNKVSATTWLTADKSGQELNIDPITNFGGAGCASSPSTVPTAQCGNPLFQPTPAGNCGAGVRYRAIGTGEMVKAVIGANSIPATSVQDAIGYSFWGYGNFAALVSKTNCTEHAGGNVNCSSYAAHYLAVDGIDPLWANPGGDTTGAVPYNLPQCSAVVFGVNSDFPCVQIPFTHVYDGTYPLWSLLRLVTFAGVGTTQLTPVGVINTVAYTQTEAGAGSAQQLSDFVPFLKTLTNSGTLTAPNWNGALNLGVFRSHHLQAKVNPGNGHYQEVGTAFSACNPASVPLVGAKKTTPVCWVDAGGDAGGSVLTVQSDLDFINDFGLSGSAKNPPNPVELYGIHQ